MRQSFAFGHTNKNLFVKNLWKCSPVPNSSSAEHQTEWRHPCLWGATFQFQHRTSHHSSSWGWKQSWSPRTFFRFLITSEWLLSRTANLFLATQMTVRLEDWKYAIFKIKIRKFNHQIQIHQIINKSNGLNLANTFLLFTTTFYISQLFCYRQALMQMEMKCNKNPRMQYEGWWQK